jgi:hypothetical protein
VYANGSATAYWSFTTIVSPPGTFNKIIPTDGTTEGVTNPILDWQDSPSATSYEYCIDTTNDNACSKWTSTGTTSQVQLSGLSNSTAYYWQVRAVNAGGSSYASGSATAFWSFTTTVANDTNIYLPLTISTQAGHE